MDAHALSFIRGGSGRPFVPTPTLTHTLTHASTHQHSCARERAGINGPSSAAALAAAAHGACVAAFLRDLLPVARREQCARLIKVRALVPHICIVLQCILWSVHCGTCSNVCIHLCSLWQSALVARREQCARPIKVRALVLYSTLQCIFWSIYCSTCGISFVSL
jgi:hypothetical protein